MKDEYRDILTELYFAGLKAVDPYQAVRKFFPKRGETLFLPSGKISLSEFQRIWVIGFGKASAPMAKAVEEILGDRISGGVINTKYGHSLKLERIKVNEAGHPVPDERGEAGAKEIIEILKKAEEKDLVIVLISGGGSALLPAPCCGINLTHKQEITRLLLECGATIEEINAIRKHLSSVKGGRLAELAYPAQVLALILSDVVGDRLDTIASGPTVPDSTTYQECVDILCKYDLFTRIPDPVKEIMEKGLRGEIPETPKEGEKIFSRVQNIIVGSNFLALSRIKEEGEKKGFKTLILSSSIQGEAKEIAKFYAGIAKEIKTSGNPFPPPLLILGGGETTVTVRGKGKGGRNQELALSFAIQIAGCADIYFLSAGTDGTDGPTDAAGAFADGKSLLRAKKLGLDAFKFLSENDSYSFFQKLNDLFITGPTRTNVMDVHLLLVT